MTYLFTQDLFKMRSFPKSIMSGMDFRLLLRLTRKIPRCRSTVHTCRAAQPYHTSSALASPSVHLQADQSLLDCSEAAAQDAQYFTVIRDFVSSAEEDQLMMDIRRTLRGKKYMFDHWDGVSGYSMSYSHVMFMHLPLSSWCLQQLL